MGGAVDETPPQTLFRGDGDGDVFFRNEHSALTPQTTNLITVSINETSIMCVVWRDPAR
jgi:hypothetical protein